MSEDHDDREEDQLPFLPQNNNYVKFVKPRSKKSLTETIKSNVITHFKFVGGGIVASVAYFDPGNWSTDLAAGSEYGYSLLGVVLIAGLGAILFQILSCRLGIVTGLDLAQHIRQQLHNRESHTLLWRWLALYPLYILAEFALIATDLSELLGSAIALNLIFPIIPLWLGVCLTALDVLIILALYEPSGSSKKIHIFEGIIAVLTLAVFASFAVLVFKVHPEWSEVIAGFLPNKLAFEPGATYISIGIIGATIMPHSMFLGSRMATIDRLAVKKSENIEDQSTEDDRITMTPISEENNNNDDNNTIDYIVKAMNQDPGYEPSPRIGDADVYEGGPGRLPSIMKHLKHASWDVALSLLTIAVPVNSAILIVASATYYKNPDGDGEGVADLFDAHDLILKYVGKPFAFIFAFALLCAGQSASITATQASQAVSEGFIQWRSPPIMRRLITRLLGIIPSLIIAISVGRSGIDQLLNASQVVLSVMLPFAIGPLIYLCGRKDVMRVWNPTTDAQSTSTTNLLDSSRFGAPHRRTSYDQPLDEGFQQFQLSDQIQLNTTGQWVDLRPSKYILIVSWIIFVGLCLSNLFVIVQVCRGKSI